METGWLYRSAAEIARAVRAGEISARRMAELSLDAISRRDPGLGAFTDLTADRALAEAVAVDAALARGQSLPLAGVPYAVKNLYDLEGIVTRAGSRINRDNPPAAKDATLVTRMRAAGALCMGALNMGEYAYDFTGENAHDGPSRNPHDPSRMTGGSSGGSGAAAAAGMVAVTLGSDTNGSIRVPASFCGLFGLKPTFGRLSRAGTFPFCASLDHLGPLARSTTDLALVFDALQGEDSDDPAQTSMPFLPTAADLDRGIEGMRIGIAGGYFRDRAQSEAPAAVETVARALGTDREITVPEAARARAAAYVITTSEASALHAGRIRTRAADYDPATRDRFISGMMVPAAWYLAAQRFRSWFRAEMAQLFDTADAIIAPATPFHALEIGTNTIMLGDVEVPARPNIGIYTQPFSFIGLPAVAVPVWLPGADLPIGVQVVAAPWREDIVLRIAHYLESRGIAEAPVAGTRG